MSRAFDAIVIGAGQAGPSLAGRLTAAGMTVAMIERKFFGGTCVNTGCMPTKTLVASARAAHVARRAADYGVVLEGGVGIDMAKVRARARKVTLDARSGLESWLKGMERCTVFEGHAVFAGPHEVAVGEERLIAPRIFINVGGPGAVDTPLHANDPVDFLKSLAPMGTISSVEDVASAVVYLTEARQVTGEVLHVDGGAHKGKW